MKWLKNLFRKKHVHSIVYTSRKHIANTSLDFTTGNSSIVDIQPARSYLIKGYCATCGKTFTGTKTIAVIFDKPQPYDVKEI